MRLQVFTIMKYLKLALIILILGAILINFVFGKEENYYLQVFLKECKYIEKEKKSDLTSY